MNIEVFRLTLIVTLLVQLIIVRTEDSRQNVNTVLANVDINTVIREAVQKELNKYGVVSIANRHNDGLTQSSSKTNCIDDENVNRCRTTHEVAGNSKTDLNRSVRDGCPDSSVLAKHNQIESELDNRHMATEMGLPQNGNPNIASAVQERDNGTRANNDAPTTSRNQLANSAMAGDVSNNQAHLN